MRGALTGNVREAHRNYHIPISNTAAATLVLENVPVKAHDCAGQGEHADSCCGSCVKSQIEAARKPEPVSA